MQIEGKKIKCDRCGLETFVEKQKELFTDRGFTRNRIYESADRWTVQNEKDLCPACSKQLKKVLDDFWMSNSDVEQKGDNV